MARAGPGQDPLRLPAHPLLTRPGGRTTRTGPGIPRQTPPLPREGASGDPPPRRGAPPPRRPDEGARARRGARPISQGPSARGALSGTQPPTGEVGARGRSPRGAGHESPPRLRQAAFHCLRRAGGSAPAPPQKRGRGARERSGGAPTSERHSHPATPCRRRPSAGAGARGSPGAGARREPGQGGAGPAPPHQRGAESIRRSSRESRGGARSEGGRTHIGEKSQPGTPCRSAPARGERGASPSKKRKTTSPSGGGTRPARR